MGWRHFQLTLPPNQRISLLSLSIWRAGIRPESWAMQCPPDFLPAAGHDPIGYAVDVMLQRLEQDRAMREQIDMAEAMLNQQGKSLYIDEAGNRVDEPNIEVRDDQYH